MRLSVALIQAWEQLEQNFTSTATAVDCFGKPCFAWEQAAVAWDGVGILEKIYFNPETGKYSKPYTDIINILRECRGAQARLDLDTDYESEVHALWWGAILTAQVDEKAKK